MIKTVWSITLHVSDMKRTVKFYEETLGLEKKYEFSSYAGFECGGVEIGLIPASGERQETSLTSPSVEFLVDDVDKFCDRLSRAGVRFIEGLHDEPWGGRQATFADPDGNILEIAQIDWKKYFDVSATGAKGRREAK
ncbi:MAG: VOC family protein [Candidatus Bathyarchaeia archaeon]|jgi:catechol 2,3-dioxygenase-like lactoylglutathione lyase family enzyme